MIYDLFYWHMAGLKKQNNTLLLRYKNRQYLNFLFCLKDLVWLCTYTVMIQSTNNRRDSESCTTIHDDNIWICWTMYHNCNKSVLWKRWKGKLYCNCFIINCYLAFLTVFIFFFIFFNFSLIKGSLLKLLIMFFCFLDFFFFTLTKRLTIVYFIFGNVVIAKNTYIIIFWGVNCV